MYWFTILVYLFLDAVVFSLGYVDVKCCKPGEYLNKNNGSYQCTETPNKRFDILTRDTDFLERNTDGECADITNNFTVFEITDGNITKVVHLDGPYFPKCCPLNYIYNSLLHSCEEKENMTHGYIKENFVKVGLINCTVIIDKDFSGDTDLYEEVINKKGPDSEYCVDENEKGWFTVRECRKDYEECKNIRCVNKCCPDGQSFVNGRKCVDTYTHGMNLKSTPVVHNPEEPFAVIPDYTCKRIYLLDERRYIFNLTKNGVFRYWYNYTNSYISEDVGHPNSYCFEHVTNAQLNGFFFFKCRTEIVVKEKFVYALVPKILSCIFLVLTILIYVFLNEIRTFFGKLLMNYCLAALLLFSVLAFTHCNLSIDDLLCKLTGYTLIFLSTASFAWLNVLCCDIWWTFGCAKPVERRGHLKKLLLYLLYGWGVPLLLTLVILSVSERNVLPFVIHPFVGTYSCLIEYRPNNYGAILFLHFPRLVMQLVNTVLFFKTIICCLKIRNEINKINDTINIETKSSFNRDKERLLLVLKLAVVMGIAFVIDVISAFADMHEMGTISKYFEIVWDCITSAQGIFIFIIFICKKKVLHDVMVKLRMAKRKNNLNRESTTMCTPMILKSRENSKTV